MSHIEEQKKQIMIFRETKKVIAELDKIRKTFPDGPEEYKADNIEICHLKQEMTTPTVQKFQSGKGRIYSIQLDKDIQNSTEMINFDKVYNKIWRQNQSKSKINISKAFTK